MESTFKQALLFARTYLVFLLGLTIGLFVVYRLERWESAAANTVPFSSTTARTANNDLFEAVAGMPAPPPPAPLTEIERDWARTAWSYFEQNTQPRTGLTNSVEKFAAASMWDEGSSLLALIAAERLGLIKPVEFDRRVSLALRSLASVTLSSSNLPNKSYNTETMQMVDYNNHPAPAGIGWSALDIGRLVIPLDIIALRYPAHASEVGQVLGRWRLRTIANEGVLHGGRPGPGGNPELLQEGRVGYEQYAAKGYALLGLEALGALDYRSHTRPVSVEGIMVPSDSRDPKSFGAPVYVLSEPYLMDNLEFSSDPVSRNLAYRVYQAQERRGQRTKIATAVSEDQLDRAPFFIYSNLIADGKPWQTVTSNGKDANEFRILSTKAAFGWNALFRTDYTRKLIEKVSALREPGRGWYAGMYEKSGEPDRALTANTNALVLESLCYQQTEPLTGWQ